MNAQTEINTDHTDAAYAWYNDPSNSKADMIGFCLVRGITLLDNAGELHSDYADIAMTCFDENAGKCS